MVCLDTVGSQKGTAWTCTIHVNGQEILLTVDTGAEVTVITEVFTEQLQLNDISPPSKHLHGQDDYRLKVAGEVKVALAYIQGQAVQKAHLHREGPPSQPTWSTSDPYAGCFDQSRCHLHHHQRGVPFPLYRPSKEIALASS